MPEYKETSLENQISQVFSDLSATDNSEVTDRDKIHRLQDLETAGDTWLRAYDNLSISDTERLRRLVLAGKTLVVFRRIRKLISSTPDESVSVTTVK